MNCGLMLILGAIFNPCAVEDTKELLAYQTHKGYTRTCEVRMENGYEFVINRRCSIVRIMITASKL